MLNDLFRQLGEWVGTLVGDWTKYSVAFSILLYLVGYLTVRFHLTAVGIGTDLAVLDERYVFTGARFLMYLVSSIPSVLMVALPLAGLTWLAGRLLPINARDRLRGILLHPHGLTIAGIVIAVLVIQLAMRQCFSFSNLLLSHELPQHPSWLVALLLDDALMPVYFSALVASCAISIAILIAARRADGDSPPTFAWGLLAFLTVVQLLLLPVNYGVLVVDKSLPRVSAIGDTPVAEGSEAWLVWEGKGGVTYLLQDWKNGRRSLVTLPGEVKQTEILGFDKILPKLFGSAARRADETQGK